MRRREGRGAEGEEEGRVREEVNESGTDWRVRER